MKAAQNIESPRVNKFYGFDYLRTIMIIVITVWHTELFGNKDLTEISLYSSGTVSMAAIICLQFLVLAVPSFFITSCFLFIHNVKSKSGYVLPRLERLLYLYLFWVALFILARYRCECSVFPDLAAKGLSHLAFFFMGQGISVYYFNFCLLVITILAIIFIRLHRSVHWFFLAISIAVFMIGPAYLITGMPSATLDYYEPSLITYWNPMNFMPYLFIALLLYHYYPILGQPGVSSKKYRLVLTGLFLLFIILSVVEWSWITHVSQGPHGAFIPPYMRLSILSGAAFCFIVSFSIKRPAGKFVSFISDYSLGIYCIQPFVIGALSVIMGRPQENVLYSAAVFILSVIGAYCARRAFNMKLV